MSNELTTKAPVNWDLELKGAQYLMKSKLVPKGIESPEAALFIILAGRDMNLSPVQSLRSMHVINGKIELDADLQLGLFHRDGGKSTWKILNDNEAILELQAPWLTAPHISAFSIKDAQRAGLTSNQTWAKYPKAMLRSRAITQGLKDAGFLLGAGCYAPGEIGGPSAIHEKTEKIIHIDHETGEVTADAEFSPQTTAAALNNLLAGPGIAEAFGIWSGLSKDEKTEVWSSLDEDAKKELRVQSDTQKTKKGLAALKDALKPKPFPEETKAAEQPHDTLDMAMAAIRRGDLDEAADLARSLGAKDKELVESEVRDYIVKHSAGSQP